MNIIGATVLAITSLKFAKRSPVTLASAPAPDTEPAPTPAPEPTIASGGSKKYKYINGNSSRADIKGLQQKLAELGFDARSGARPLRRVIRTMVEDPLAEMLLRGALSPGDAAELIVRDGTVAVDKTGA